MSDSSLPGADYQDGLDDHDIPVGELGTEWYQRAYRAFREWFNEEPPEQTTADELAEIDPDDIVAESSDSDEDEGAVDSPEDVGEAEDVVVAAVGSVGLPAAVLGADDDETAVEWPAPVVESVETDPELIEAAQPAAVVEAEQVVAETDPALFADEAAPPESAGQPAEMRPPITDTADVPEKIGFGAAGVDADESDFEFIEVAPPVGRGKEAEASGSGVHADSEQVVDPELLVRESDETAPKLIEAEPELIEAASPVIDEAAPPLVAGNVVGVAETGPAFAEEAARLEAAGQVVEVGPPMTPEAENAPEQLAAGTAGGDGDESDFEMFEVAPPVGRGKEAEASFSGVHADSEQVIDPELLVRESDETAPEMDEADPELIEGVSAAQTAGERQAENVESPPQEGQLMSDPLIRAAAKLTDPVDIGAAKVPVGGLTRSDQETSDTDRQSLSAEGADGTSSTLDSKDGGGRDYEPPSTWDRLVQNIRFDSDHDDDGIPDNMQDSDGDGLSNYAERWLHDTDPHNADTDGDGLKDLTELKAGTDPSNPDTDTDGLKDGFEVAHGTDPAVANTDGKGPNDGQEDDDLDGLTAVEEQASDTDPTDAYSDGVHHDKTGLSLDEADADGQLRAGRDDIFRREAEAEAAEIAAGPRFRFVNEGDAEYAYEYSNLFMNQKFGVGNTYVTETATGNPKSVTDLPHGAVIRVRNEDDIAKLQAKTKEIEDGREELPKDDRGPLERAWDYKNGVKLEPAEKAPPGGEFERGGFDGEGEGEGDFPAFAGASGEWEPGAFEDRQREGSADTDGDGTTDEVDPDSLSIDKTSPDVEGAHRSPASPFESDETPLTPAGGDLGREMPISTVEEESPVGQSVDPADVFDEVRSRTPDPSGGPGGSASADGSDSGMDFASQGEESGYRWEDDASFAGAQGGSAGGNEQISGDIGSPEPQENEQDMSPGASGESDGHSDDSDNSDDKKLTKVEQFDSKTGEGTTWYVDDDGGWYDKDQKPIPAGDVPEDVQEQNEKWVEEEKAAAGASNDAQSEAGLAVRGAEDGGYAPGSIVDDEEEKGPKEDDPDNSWYDPDRIEDDDQTDDGQSHDDGAGASDDGVSTSVDPLGGDGSSKAGREAAASVGAPQNGVQALPIDPQRWDGATVEGRDLKSMVTSDDLAQPGPEDGQGGDHLRDNVGVDANASVGLFGTGSIDKGPDHVDVQTEGPYQDDPNFPTAAQTSESESTQGAPLREVELGTALRTDQAAGGAGPQRVGSDPVAGIDGEFVGRLEMSLATTGSSDTPLTAHDDGSDTPDDDFGEGESGSVTPAKPDTASDDGFGKGDLDQSPSDSSKVSSPAGDIVTAEELGGVSTEKADALGIPQDEPLVEVAAEVAKTDTAPLPDDESSIDGEDLAGVGKADVLEMWEA